MPDQLLKLAEKEGIRIVYWDFIPPLEAVYTEFPGLPPSIGLSKRITRNRAHYRTVLAEELGHHYTTVGDHLPKEYFHYSDRLETGREEHRAMRWAAECLLPDNELEYVMLDHQITEEWALADFFCVDESLITFKFGLLSEQWKGHLQGELVQEGIIDEGYQWKY
jgi:Zn-dependent peptidase ImmA (M78 family)